MTEKRVSEISSEYLVDAATNQPTGYKLSELGLIPEDWSVSNVKDISVIPMQNGLFYEPKRKGKGVPLINVGDMYKSAPVNVESLELFDASTNEIKIFKVAVGDLFFTRSSVVPSGIAFCNIYNSEQENVVFDSHLIRVRPNKELVDPNYLYLNCIAKHARSALIASAKTATMTTIDQGAINRCPVLLPPIKEQTAIANALSDVDALIQALEKLIAKKQAIKTATMQQLLTGRTRLPPFGFEKSAHHPDGRKKGFKPSELGEIPEDWELVVLGEVCDFENGDRSSNYPAANEFSAVGIPFINAGHVSDGQIDSKNMDYIPQFVFDRLGGGKVKSGDLVYCLRGSLGKFGVITDSFGFGAVASSLVIVRPNKLKTSTSYLTTYFKSEIAKKMISLWAGGAAQPNLGAKELAKFSIPLPAGDEQMAISSIFTQMDEEVLQLEQRLSKTRQIKQGMMQELLTGKTRLVKPAGAA